MEMVEEFKKTPADRDMILIYTHMQHTFALRREEIVTLAPPIAEFKARWPGLFSEAHVYGEFHRVASQNLQYSFFAALDRHTPQLLKLYKQRRTGAFGEKMTDLLMAYEEQDKNDITAARTAAVAGLPLYLKEDSSEILKSCKEEECETFQVGAVALVAVVDEEDTVSGIPFHPRHVSVILEDQVVMSLKSWTNAVVVLFGLIYALNLSYPAKLSSFFEFIQVSSILMMEESSSKQSCRP